MSEEALPLVLLHAYPLSARQWDGYAEAFAGRRVLAPDLPGFGREPPSADTLDGFASAVVDAMDRARIQKAIVLGLSMGGYVAFRLHAGWPERIAGLILADTRAGSDSPEAREKRTLQAQRARTEGAGWLADAFIPDALGETTRTERPEVVDRVRGMVESSDPEGLARALIAMRDRPDSRPDLPGVRVPVLVLVGAEDRLTPVEEARVIADGVPEGRLAVIPRAGHLSNLEHPEAFLGEVRRFLDGDPVRQG